MPSVTLPNIGTVKNGWTSAESNWGSDMNQNLVVFDDLIQIVVKDTTLTSPPGSPVDGDRYIVAASPTGLWSGQATKIARYVAASTAWIFYTPKTGWKVTVGPSGTPANATLQFNGTSWGAAPALSYFVESQSTSGINATQPVNAFTATSTYANADVALCPKGGGSITARIADGTSTGGPKRGTSAVDFQVFSNGVTAAAATGDYSVLVGGSGNTSAAAYCVVGGGNNNSVSSTGIYGFLGGGSGNSVTGSAGVVVGGGANQATAAYAVVCGGSSNKANATFCSILGGSNNITSGNASTIAGGLLNTASGDNSLVSGYDGYDFGIAGARVHSSQSSFNTGGSQILELVLTASTSNATATRMRSNISTLGANNQFSLGPRIHALVRGQIVAREQVSGYSASWEFVAHIKREFGAGTTALVSAVTATQIAADSGAAGWAVSITADTTYDALAVTVTGLASTSIHWTCGLRGTMTT